MIRIISESSIAAGIRRIEAITGEATESFIDDISDTLRAVGEMFHNAPDIRQAIRKAIDENVELRKQAEEFMKERTRSIAAAAVGVNGCKVVSMIGVRAPEMVKNVAFLVRQLSPEATAFIAATSDISGKPLLTVALTDDLVKKGVNASTMVREAAKAIKGGGGGQPGFAQAGGKDTDGLSVAIETLRQSLM